MPALIQLLLASIEKLIKDQRRPSAARNRNSEFKVKLEVALVHHIVLTYTGGGGGRGWITNSFSAMRKSKDGKASETQTSGERELGRLTGKVEQSRQVPSPRGSSVWIISWKMVFLREVLCREAELPPLCRTGRTCQATETASDRGEPAPPPPMRIPT